MKSDPDLALATLSNNLPKANPEPWKFVAVILVFGERDPKELKILPGQLGLESMERIFIHSAAW